MAVLLDFRWNVRGDDQFRADVVAQTGGDLFEVRPSFLRRGREFGGLERETNGRDLKA